MSDVFRKKYHILKPENTQKIKEIKECAEALYSHFTIENREMNIAKTNLEQTMMWATKAIVLNDETEQNKETKND